MREAVPVTVPVTFAPEGVTVWVEAGTTVLDAARRAQVAIDAPCAGRGICGGCGVRVVEGELEPPDSTETQGLRRAPVGVRLACRARVYQPVTVRPIAAARAVSVAESSSEGTETIPGRCVAAVDLGTTGVAAVIIDAESRLELGRAVVENAQRAWGADVLARIAHAREGGGRELARAAERSIEAALAAACAESGRCLGGIERLVIAGNTAMASLLLEADVASLAAHPFEAPYRGITDVPSASPLRERIAPGARALVLPALAGFVGGDTLAGLVATGLAASGQRGMLLDLGTNAELVIATGAEVLASSTAAGPAFEASGITSGGPATIGAVARIDVGADGEPVLDVIGGREPKWLCGSGIVSLVATLRSLGHLDASGLMIADGPWKSRFSRADGVVTITLQRPDVEDAPTIELTQNDVRALQLAKGAVRAAIETMVGRGGAASIDADTEVLVAGAFGNALATDDLAALGVLPLELAENARVVGNASLAGAAMIAMDESLETLVRGLPARVTGIDLAADPAFGGRFLQALSLEPYQCGDAQAG